MVKFLIKKFIPDSENTASPEVREKYGVLSGTLGIIFNLLLFALKLTVGIITASVAVISDAFNNLSDLGTTLVALVGSKLSTKKPDRAHPFGHGRIEYITSLVISLVIILVGFELLKSSAVKIINPSEAAFDPFLTALLLPAVFVKLYMYFYNSYMGEKIDSGVLRAAAADSLNDVLSTSAVIASTVVGGFVSLPLDGIMGALVSCLIMYTGFGIARETVTTLLGAPPDEEVVRRICDIISSGENVSGMHDLIVHDYGPGRKFASVHAEIPVDMDIIKIHEEIDALERKILSELGIFIVIHMDPILVDCEKTNRMKEEAEEIIKEINPEFSLHDFRITDGEKNINVIFDLTVPADTENIPGIIEEIGTRLKQRDERCNAVISVDYLYV